MTDEWGFGGSVEETPAEDDESSGDFEDELREAVDNGNLDSLDPSYIGMKVHEVDDVELLREAVIADTRSEALRYFESRFNKIGVEDTEEDEESHSDQTAPSESESEAMDDSENDAEQRTGEGDGLDRDELGDDATVERSPSSEGGEPSDESVDGEPSPPTSVADGSGGEGTGIPTPESARTFDEGDDERIWRVMPWGEPGTGKSHFGLSMPEPVAFIDTEGSVGAISPKFASKESAVWQPTTYGEAVDAMEEAIEWLQQWLDTEGKRGTIVVDSMTDMWEWSQSEYVRRYMPMKDPDEVDATDFTSKMQEKGGGPSQWQKIKRLHNAKFRNVIVDSDFHLCFTCRSADNIKESMETDISRTPKKPKGETDNEYFTDFVIHLREEGGSVYGHLEKSLLTKNKFRDMEWPTFDKMRQVVLDIYEAERNPEKVPIEGITDLDVDITASVGTRYEAKRHERESNDDD